MEKIKLLAAGSVLSGKTNQYTVERMLCDGGSEDATYLATTMATVGDTSVRVMVAIKVEAAEDAEDVTVIERFSDEEGVTYTVTEYVEPRHERTSPWPIVAIVCGLLLVVSVFVFSECSRREKVAPVSTDSVKVEQPIAPATDVKPAAEAPKAEPKKEVAKEPVKEKQKEKAKENKESKKKDDGNAKKGDTKTKNTKAKDKQKKSDTKPAAPDKEKAKDKTSPGDAKAKAK